MQTDEAFSMLNFAIKKQAEKNLLKLNMSDYPMMKKEDRKKLFNSLREPLNKDIQVQTTKDLVGFLNGK